MQNNAAQLEMLFRLTVQEARRNTDSNLPLRERVLYSLLVQARQAVTQRKYTLAVQCKLLRQVVERSTTLKLAHNELVQAVEREANSVQNTPASNTGVTDTGAAVPEDYFTGGKS